MTRTMTGDEGIDHLLHRIDASATRLRLLAALTPREEEIVAKVDGGYLNTLIEKYNAMPPAYRTCEMDGGRGTPRDALIKSLSLMVTLLRHSEERISGMSAATIVVERDRLQDQVDAIAMGGDVTPIRFADPKPDPWWVKYLTGAALFVVGLVLLFVLVLIVAFLIFAGSAERTGPSTSSIPSWSVLPIAIAVGTAFYYATRGSR